MKLPSIYILSLLLLLPFILKGQEIANDPEKLLDKAITFRSSNHDSLLYYCELALEVSKKTNNSKAEIETLHELSYVYRENAQYDEALAYALNAKELLTKSSDTNLLAVNDYMLGGIYFEKDKFEEAIDHYKASLPRFEQTKNFDKYTYALNGIANVYSYTGKIKEAAEYYTKALASLKLTKGKRLPGTINNNVANFYLKQKDFVSAEKYLQIAEKAFRDANLEVDLSSIYFNYGFIERDRKNYTKAIEDFNKCLTIGKKFDFYEDQVNAYKELEGIYKSLNDYKMAYLCADSFRSINEKLHSQNLEQTISEMEAKFKLEEKNKLLEIKQQEIKADQEKIRAETITIIILITAIAIIVIFTIFLIIVLRKNRLKNKYLEKRNTQINRSKERINKTLAEKETLIKEIHHRVKNNLQVISSLLNLQVNSSINDEVVKELNVAKDRIYAISLVHQKLYSGKDFEKINIGDYARDIIQQQSAALGENVVITSNIDTDNILLNITTSVPIGIILNELVTNCFKYAFKGRDTGKISISIKHIKEDQYCMIFRDNGIGFPDDFKIEDLSSLGMEIIHSLAEQVNGKVKCYNDDGAVVELMFKEVD